MPRTQTADTTPAKERLIEAAIKIFAEQGFEGASTRQIAKEAQVNISAILYYFEGKDGLYLAAMQHLADLMKSGVGEGAKPIAEALASRDVPPEECRAMLHQFLRGAMGFMLSDRVSPYAVRIFVREQADPSPVFEMFYATMQPAQQTFLRLIARLTGLKEGSEALALCCHTVLGQMIVFRTHREMFLRRTGWKTLDDAAIAKIAATILPQTDAIIDYYRNMTRVPS